MVGFPTIPQIWFDTADQMQSMEGVDPAVCGTQTCKVCVIGKEIKTKY